MKMRFTAFSFRKIENPYDKERRHMHTVVVEASDLPKDLGEWKGVNPRDANLKTGVSQTIRQSIDDAPEKFFFLNRGLVLVVKEVTYDNASKQVELVLDDKEKHGLLDGGHTYAIMQEALSEHAEEKMPFYINVQIMSGFKDRDEVVDLVAARNTSRQVRDESLQNLHHNFDPIKKALEGQPYADKIAYSEYVAGEDGKPRPIPIVEILSYLMCFDVDGFGEETHPYQAYSSKGAVLSHFKDNLSRMSRLAPLLPEILALRDSIYLAMPDVYNKGGGKFGGLTGVKTSDRPIKPLYFIGQTSRFGIPSSFIYPVLASFRPLVNKRPRSYEWAGDPVEAFENHKTMLIRRLGNHARQMQNPSKLGKDPGIWLACYDALDKALLRSRAA